VAALAAGVAVALTVPAWPARAQAARDQVNDPPATTTFSCGGGTLMRQSFTPGLPVVSAVEIRLRAGGSFPAAGLSLRLRLLAPDGTERGRGTADVAGPLAAGAQVLARFDLAVPVPAGGGQLVIAWESTGPAELSWFGTDGDPYPRGEAYACGGAPVTGRDYNFVTYGYSPAIAPTATPAPPATPAPTPAPVCPQIRGRVPDADIAAAVADPGRVAGHGALERPDLPASPYNRPRTWLSLRSLDVPYGRLSNGLVWRGGCP
jgi:hypothetical protein